MRYKSIWSDDAIIIDGIDVPYPRSAPARKQEWAANCTCCSTPWTCPSGGRSWPKPFAWSCVSVARPLPVRAPTEDVDGEEKRGESEKRKRRRRIEWWGKRAWALQFVNVRTIRHPSVRRFPLPAHSEREWKHGTGTGTGTGICGGSLALGYSHRDYSRVPEICHNAYAAKFQCWTARVCHSERWFIAWRGRMARETTAGEFTK